MALGQTYPFGMRQITLQLFDATGTPTGATVPLPDARKMTFTEAETFVELRGGDKTVRSRGTGASTDWELEGGGLSFEAWAVLAGGTVTTSGVTPNQIKTYKKLATDARPYFKAKGRSISDSGGDFTVVLYRCRTTKDLKGELADGAWWVTACSGQGFPSLEATAVDALYDFIQNETAAALP